MGYSVYQGRNNGRDCWVAVYDYYDEGDSAVALKKDRRRRYIRGYGHTRTEARSRLDANIQRRFGAAQESYRSSGPTLTQFMETWLEWKAGTGLGDESQRKYRRDLETHILPHVGNTKLENLTSKRLEEVFYKDLKKTGTSARAHTYKTLQNCLNYAVRTGELEASPLNQVQRPTHQSIVAQDDETYSGKRVKVFTALLKKLREKDYVHHEYYPMILMELLGLRRGELLGLEWSCITGLERKGASKLIVRQQLARHEKSVTGKSGYYIKRRTKSGQNRTIYLPETFRKALLDQKKKGRVAMDDQFSDLIFLQENGRHYDFGKYSRTWKEILGHYMRLDGRTTVDSDYWRPHANRHIAASLLFEQGASIEIVQDILGHLDKTMTLHYTHMSKEARQRAADGLEAAL